jgi:hypothetical protein
LILGYIVGSSPATQAIFIGVSKQAIINNSFTLLVDLD